MYDIEYRVNHPNFNHDENCVTILETTAIKIEGIYNDYYNTDATTRAEISEEITEGY